MRYNVCVKEDVFLTDSINVLFLISENTCARKLLIYTNNASVYCVIIANLTIVGADNSTGPHR